MNYIGANRAAQLRNWILASTADIYHLQLQARIKNFSLELRIGGYTTDKAWPSRVEPVLLVRRKCTSKVKDDDGKATRLMDSMQWRRLLFDSPNSAGLMIPAGQATSNGWRRITWDLASRGRTKNAHTALSNLLLEISTSAGKGVKYNQKNDKWILVGQTALKDDATAFPGVRHCPHKLAVALAVNETQAGEISGFRIVSNVIPIDVTLRSAIAANSLATANTIKNKLNALYGNYVWQTAHTEITPSSPRYFVCLQDATTVAANWHYGVGNHLMRVRVGT